MTFSNEYCVYVENIIMQLNILCKFASFIHFFKYIAFLLNEENNTKEEITVKSHWLYFIKIYNNITRESQTSGNNI